jgi:stage II sporulation protein D
MHINIKNFILILIVLFGMCRTVYAIDTVKENIAVGLMLDCSSFIVGSSKEFLVCDTSNKKMKLTRGFIKISCSEEGVYIGKYFLSLPVKVESSDGIIYAQYKPYRGYLIIKKSSTGNNKITVINVLPIEDYLKGVLPKETDCTWTIEALKTQAIVSRTYSIANLNKHLIQGFDVCSTTHCQVYGGASVETDLSNKAILDTKCEVLTYNETLAQTVFHANCGGHTEDPKYVWNWGGNTPPYLKGVKCGFCTKTQSTNWKKTLDEVFIKKKLSVSNNIPEKIKKIKIKGRTSSGSTKELEIIHSKGKLKLNAYRFRLAVDACEIKSHGFCSIKKHGGKFHFKGKGWGHKVGLCQCGAKVMAEKGESYKKILAHFYPGTKIGNIIYK